MLVFAGSTSAFPHMQCTLSSRVYNTASEECSLKGFTSRRRMCYRLIADTVFELEKKLGVLFEVAGKFSHRKY